MGTRGRRRAAWRAERGIRAGAAVRRVGYRAAVFTFDGVLVLGKELRRDPERARRELAARAAAAAAAVRAGAPFVATLEAKLDGQAESGAALMRGLLLELGVPAAKLLVRDVSRSTREEAWIGTAVFAEHRVRRGLVITAGYHVARSRRLFAEALAPAEVHAPMALWRWADARERAWIAAGEPDAAALQAERRVELTFGALETCLRPLPVGLRTMLEVRAGGWFRGDRSRG